MVNINIKLYILNSNKKSYYLIFLDATYITYNASIKKLNKVLKSIWTLILAFLALLKTLINKFL